jgi:hypothetical protein
VPLNVIQRHLGHAKPRDHVRLLQGIDNVEIIDAGFARAHIDDPR